MTLRRAKAPAPKLDTHSGSSEASKPARSVQRTKRLKVVGPRLEIHEHSYVAGFRPHIAHSHHDGSSRHQHPEVGPASYTIDKDEWYAATGLRGGGRKKYSPEPSGPQLPWMELEEWQKFFKVVFTDTGHTAEHERAGITPEQYEQQRADFQAAAAGNVPEMRDDEPGDGGGAVARMAMGFDLDVIYVYEDHRSAS